jgi:ATP-dependent DNA ligase
MRESRPLASRERQPCREMESPFRWVESRATRLHQSTMSLRPGTLAAGFVWPCLPTKTHEPPSGGLWIHDGFRIIARKNGERVRLYSRPGNDLTRRFPLIVETLARLCSRSCIIDGEAVACDDNGVASFDLIRNHRANEIPLCAALGGPGRRGRTGVLGCPYGPSFTGLDHRSRV